MSQEALARVIKNEKHSAALEWISRHAAELFENTEVVNLKLEFHFQDGSGFATNVNRMKDAPETAVS